MKRRNRKVQEEDQQFYDEELYCECDTHDPEIEGMEKDCECDEEDEEGGSGGAGALLAGIAGVVLGRMV